MYAILKQYRVILDRKQKKNIVGLLLMMIVGTFLEVLGVGMMLPLATALMDENLLTNNELAGKIAGFLGITSSRAFIVLCILIIVVIFIIKNFYIILQGYVSSGFIYSNRLATQSRILKAYMMKPYEFFLSNSSGETIRTVKQDVTNVFSLLSYILDLFAESLITIALLVTIYIVNPMMVTLTVAVMAVTIFILIKVIRPKMSKVGKIYTSSDSITNKWLLQMVTGIKEIKVSHTQKYFQDNFDKFAKKNVDAVKKQAIWINSPKMLIEMTSVCTALVAVAIQVSSGRELTSLITSLSAFIMAALRLLPGANRIVYSVSQIAFFAPSVDKVTEMISFAREAENESKILKLTDKYSLTVNNEIELSNITYRYPTGEKIILSDASMKIPVGKSIGIVGPSGAGKTTSIDILLGLLHPSKGQVLSDGVDISEHYEEWLSHIGYIPQMIFMLDGTIRENVVFGNPKWGNEGKDNKSLDDYVWKALKEAQLEDLIREMPAGLDTEIGERGIRLSGGQRQRLGIARALYSDPEVLFFDEATSSLDNETEASIMESINALHGKKTLIIIAHRLSTIQDCDIIYRVEGGKITVDNGVKILTKQK